jgi:hypothetical protein
MEWRDIKLLKQKSPIYTICPTKIIEEREEHSSKQHFGRDFTEHEISIERRDLL